MPFSDTDWIGGAFTTARTYDDAKEKDTEPTQEEAIKKLRKGLRIASKALNF